MELTPDFSGIDLWILRRIAKMPSFLGHYRTGAVFGVEGTVLAAVGFDAFTRYECCMHLVVEDPRGVTRGTLRSAFEAPFIHWGLQRVSALVAGSNRNSRDFLERCGFKFEGVKRAAIDGEDELVYGMLKSECRWIR